MNPMKDLRGVADLITEAFANDLDRSGHNALQELRWLSRFKPLLWWMLFINFERTDYLSGFVWENHGRIVGNVTVNQIGPTSNRWLISNLAVAKDNRGQGIARQLLQAAEEFVRDYRGSRILLQVRANNRPAKQLYESFGFAQIGGTAYLKLNRLSRVSLSPLPSGLVLRTRLFSSKDNFAVYQLAKATIQPEIQSEWPLRQSQFRLPFNILLQNTVRTLTRNRHAYWVVDNGREIVATITIKPELFGTPHTIELMVHPDWRGYLEPPLISRALNYLHRSRNSTVLVKQPADHVEAVQTYQHYQFHEEQTLLWMKLSL